MKKLPQEIRNEIFCLLASKDRFTCLRVSKEWNKWMTPYIYNRLEIKSAWRLAKAIKHFTKYPNVAKLVEFLTIDNCYFKKDVFNLLKTTTQLLKLTVGCLQLTKSDLDILHEKLRNLKSLKLSNLDFVATVDENSDSITVPVYLADLDVEFRHYSDIDYTAHEGIAALTDYISQKYKGLFSFSFTIAIGTVHPVNISPIERSILSLLDHCPQLKRYKHVLCPITPIFMQVMDASGIQLENITIYVNQETANDQLHAIVKSGQANSIRNVSLITFSNLITYDPFDNSIQMQVFESLAPLKKLTDLSFGSYYKDCTFCITSLIQCLNCIPWLLNVSVLNMRPVSYENPSIPHVLQIKCLTIDTVWIHSRHDLAPTNAAINLLLQHSPDLQKFVFKAQLFLEISNFDHWETLFTLVLDLGAHTKLKSIDIDMGHDTNEFYHIRDSLGRFKYFEFDQHRNRIVERESLPRYLKYYTTILLASPTAICFNSYFSSQVNPVKPVLYTVYHNKIQ